MRAPHVQQFANDHEIVGEHRGAIVLHPHDQRRCLSRESQIVCSNGSSCTPRQSLSAAPPPAKTPAPVFPTYDVVHATLRSSEVESKLLAQSLYRVETCGADFASPAHFHSANGCTAPFEGPGSCGESNRAWHLEACKGYRTARGTRAVRS